MGKSVGTQKKLETSCPPSSVTCKRRKKWQMKQFKNKTQQQLLEFHVTQTVAFYYIQYINQSIKYMSYNKYTVITNCYMFRHRIWLLHYLQNIFESKPLWVNKNDHYWYSCTGCFRGKKNASDNGGMTPLTVGTGDTSLGSRDISASKKNLRIKVVKLWKKKEGLHMLE